jgi:transposase-like protein
MPLKNKKKCLKCGERSVFKDGQQSGRQRYKCRSCGHRFQYKKK